MKITITILLFIRRCLDRLLLAVNTALERRRNRSHVLLPGTYIPSSPAHPCPQCGKETKKHHTPPGSRICSARACRFIVAEVA